ncbi:FAD-binding oxidoreductase [Shinella sp. DD12]|jgi:glycine/D-amino acid oxidase-like deaminating enzyme|uniref:NAD(P)/FAD-dependent oxidoreductase n=1 Tax=Shinella sp. DD12 TaxID=1410620 RepID=UPI0003C56E5B|nr:FAD-dependent oxidoreductase [Shinella sp. DD12]EYR77952.1 putative sarcosine/opine oxidase subunit B-like dehydrogenase FAD-dependent dehydrogenase [Shinella sp. DD12]MCA0343153.1 FAD-binding oxidoreductase [Pseudomonadota bacterium]
MQPRPPSSVIVIGSGIVGAATAYFLSERGVAVRLLEASAPAAEATGAADGAVSVASKRPGPMMTAALKGVALYGELADSGLFAGAFKRRSTFIVAASDEECTVLEAHSAALASTGVKVETLAGSRLRQIFPALSQNARMAVEVHGEGHAIGYQIVHRLLTAAGIMVERDTDVKALRLADGGRRIAAVETNRGSFSADKVVITAGTGSAALIGLSNVLTPRKGQLLVTERALELNASMPGAIMSGRYLLSKGSQKAGHAPPPRGLGLVIDPLVTGQFLIGGTREDFGKRETNDIDAVSRILADAVALVPDLARLRLLRSFAGVRTAVVDGLPLIGRLPDVVNGFVATGFEGDGICLGPITGMAIAQLICGEVPALDLSSFDPARFPVRGMAA